MRINLTRSLETSSVSSTTSGTKTSSTSTEATPEVGASSSLSGPAKLLKALEELKSSDPAAFKEKLTAIAQALTEAAETSTDPGEQQMLKDLAGKFTQAESTGDLSALTPPQGEPPSGPPPSGPPPSGPPPSGPPPDEAASQESSSSATAVAGLSASSVTYEPADANEDGKVTYQEQAAYDAKTAAQAVTGALPGAEEPTSRGVRTYREQADQHATEAQSALWSKLAAILGEG